MNKAIREVCGDDAVNMGALNVVPHTLKWALFTGLLSSQRFEGLHPWLAIKAPFVVEKLKLNDAGNSELEYIRFAGKFDSPQAASSATEWAFFDEAGQEVTVMCKTGHMKDFWRATNVFPSFWDWYRWAIDDAEAWQKLGAEAEEVTKGNASNCPNAIIPPQSSS